MDRLTLFEPGEVVNEVEAGPQPAEEWRAVPVAPFDRRYEVSNQGRVRSNAVSTRWGKGGRILVKKPGRKGGMVGLFVNGKGETLLRVADLVAAAFLPTRPSEAHYLIRVDGDDDNDTAANLAWEKLADPHSLPGEEWRPVNHPDFCDTHMVSNFGRVRVAVVLKYSCNGTTILKSCLNTNGYPQIALRARGKQKCFRVHTLVAGAFLGPPPFPGAMVRHKNDNRLDNRPENLVWGTSKENGEDRARNRRMPHGEKHSAAKATEEIVRAIRREYVPGKVSQQSLADRYGLDQTVVSDIVRRVTWKHVQ